MNGSIEHLCLPVIIDKEDSGNTNMFGSNVAYFLAQMILWSRLWFDPYVLCLYMIYVQVNY